MRKDGRRMCDRHPLRANVRHWRQRPRKRRQGALTYLHDNLKAKCQVCPLQALEDVRHVLEWCDNDAAKEIRTSWYERLREKAVKAAPALWEAIRSGLRCERGNLVAARGTAVAAWHAVTGKIPILWTEAALGAGVERA